MLAPQGSGRMLEVGHVVPVELRDQVVRLAITGWHRGFAPSSVNGNISSRRACIVTLSHRGLQRTHVVAPSEEHRKQTSRTKPRRYRRVRWLWHDCPVSVVAIPSADR